jgi:ABC-type phosphate/phosphonate transport system substrate-binding protein
VRQDSPWQELADLRGARCLINTGTSHSGMNILRAMVAPLHESGRFFASVQVSGAHRTSLARISRGRADVAAIDCVTYALVQRHSPSLLAGTRVLCRTQSVPAPPFVTRAGLVPEDLARLRDALTATLEDPEVAWAREATFLAGCAVRPIEAYDAIVELERLADQYGYFEIHSGLGAEP